MNWTLIIVILSSGATSVPGFINKTDCEMAAKQLKFETNRYTRTICVKVSG